MWWLKNCAAKCLPGHRNRSCVVAILIGPRSGIDGADNYVLGLTHKSPKRAILVIENMIDSGNIGVGHRALG